MRLQLTSLLAGFTLVWTVGCAQAAEVVETRQRDAAKHDQQTEAALREAFEEHWKDHAKRRGATATPEEKERAFLEFRHRLAEQDKRSEAAIRRLFESAWQRKLKRTGETPPAAEKEREFQKYLAEVKIKNRLAMTERETEAARKTRLVLTGQVVDQDGRSVPSAKVSATVSVKRTIGLILRRETLYHRQVKTTTDRDGLFKLDGGKGTQMRLKRIEATGYRFFIEQQPVWLFHVGPTHAVLPYMQDLAVKGDVTFTMWRIAGKPEKLVVAETGFRVPREGKGFLFNVFVPLGKRRLTRITDGEERRGDLLFNVSHTSGGKGYRLVVAAVHGGLMGADPNAFIAPQTGYEQSWAVDLKDGGTTQILFVRSRAGRAHTRLVLEAEPWIGKGVAYLTLNYCVNPTGSRNLQPGGGRFASHELPRLDVQTWPGAVAKQDDDD